MPDKDKAKVIPAGQIDSLRREVNIQRVKLIYPDGVHELPSGDSADRPIYTTLAGSTIPLPTGASTAANQLLELAQLVLLVAKDYATQTTLAAMNAKFVTGTDIGDVTINNAAGAGAYVQPGTSTSWNGLQLNELIPAAYDYVDCTNGAYGPTSVVYKTGGAGGATVATLTIVYDGTTGLIDTVTRT